ncbi:MAG: hypothetical protein GY852_01365 [bacterium]|nr:hypothetical protein [bacterium]
MTKGTAKNIRSIKLISSISPVTPRMARWKSRLMRIKLRELKEKGIIHPNMSHVELRNGHYKLANSNSNDSRTPKDVETVASCWAKFYENASPEEREQEFASFTRMVDEVYNLVYSTNRLSIAQNLLDSLYSLIPIEPQYILHKLMKLMNGHWEENVQVLALTRIEASYPFMVSTPENSLFYIMRSVLNLYERDQDHLFRTAAQEFAKTTSSFIFAHRDYLMKNGYKDLLAYSVAWAIGISPTDRVTFMGQIADKRDTPLKVEVFSRVPTLVGIMPERTHAQTPITQAMASEFPELGRVLKNNKKLTRMQERTMNQRVVDAANRLLWNSGVQFVYPAYSTGLLH